MGNVIILCEKSSESSVSENEHKEQAAIINRIKISICSHYIKMTDEQWLDIVFSLPFISIDGLLAIERGLNRA